MNKCYLFLPLLLFTVSGLFGQYSETFPVANKGILSGPCTGTEGTTCLSNDFAGVNWTIEGNLSGIDSEPFATNASNQLVVTDIDEEACWVSPVLSITGASASFSVDLTWLGYDPDAGDGADYIDVEYTTDGGANWVALPNLIGGGTHTIEYAGGTGADGSTTLSISSIVGSTLQIRVCIDHNSAAETTTISNIFAFGANLAVSGPECDLALSSITPVDENCPGSADGSITVVATTSNGPLTYSISGPLSMSNANGVFSNLPPGTYNVAVSDNAIVGGTCTVSGQAIIGAGEDLTPPTASGPAAIEVSCPAEVPVPNVDLITDETDDCTVLCTSEPWINEFHYDNDGTDTGEFIEIAGPAGLDLSAYSIYVYDGATREWSLEITPTVIIPDEQNGFGVFVITTNLLPQLSLQNQMEGIALVKGASTVIEFLSYEGSFVAVNGPAMGMTSLDVGVQEPADQAANESLSRIGTGNTGTEFTFADQLASPGSLNGNQTIVPCPENVVTVSYVGQTDNAGAGSVADPLIITHLYRVTDAAGNFTDLEHNISVIDRIAPLAICQDSLSVELDTSGMAMISADLIDLGSTDNCGMVNLSIDKETLSCEDLGEQTISLMVTDATGLSSTCSTLVTVTATEELCPTVGIRDRNAAVLRLPLYPNPADAAVTVDLSGLPTGKGPMELMIVNTLGQVLSRFGIANQEEPLRPLDTAGLPAGMYYVQLRAGHHIYAADRLIIKH